MILAAFVTFTTFAFMATHLSPQTMRRLVGYKGWVDLLLHGTILYVFLGTSTMGLLQAEAAGILVSIYLRLYAWLWGYERIHDARWVRFPGVLTRFA